MNTKIATSAVSRAWIKPEILSKTQTKNAQYGTVPTAIDHFTPGSDAGYALAS